jgi:excisionase family DNA binding protein
VSIPNYQQRERVMNPMESGNEILTIKEVCDLLQVHPTTIYKLVRKGKIPSFRIGSDWRFRGPNNALDG